jgi:photosystem II stability/assembly factor-like uncharacterized protein
MKRLVFSTWTLLFLASALAGCGDKTTAPGPPPVYQSIVITSPTDTLNIGASVPLSATVTDTNGVTVSNPELVWVSSDSKTASVDGSGKVTALREGRVHIAATGGGAISNSIGIEVIPGRGWIDQSNGALTLNNLNGVHFPDGLNGWAVGDVGTILATNDAGVHWHRQTSNSTGYSLNSVFFTGALRGFVVGSAGRILETTDGGTSWKVRTGIDTDAGRGLNDIYFVTSSVGFIVGNTGLILRTTDGGTTWTRLLPGVTGVDLLSVWATNLPGPEIRAWAVGAGGEIVGTDDGGDSWQNTITPGVPTQDLHAVVRLSKDNALAVGRQNTVAYTVLNGTAVEWLQAPPPSDFTEFFGLAWRPVPPIGSRAFGVGELSGLPRILRSIDDGQSWTIQDLPSSAVISGHGLLDVWFLDENHGWAVGRQGAILHTATGGSD